MKSRPHRKKSHAGSDKVYIYGRHALEEALVQVPHILKKVFLAPEIQDTSLSDALRANNIPVSELGRGGADDLVGRDAVHQGVIAIIDPGKLLITLEEFLATVDKSKNPAVAVLGEVQDPHNVGAIIRSAAAFGLSAVLIPTHNQAGITGTVVKTSAGMAFRIPLVSIGNVNDTLRKLKDAGFWVYGLDMEGTVVLSDEKFDAPAAFVIGNEGAGIREKTLELCDINLSIPMHPRTESLNAAVSAALVFHAWSGKHPEALTI
ncbi:MAG: 23S rRNA (guanosine(2251)-2'-O)-methyltransferase RlmB [Candidatus Pacebacteria bacterium]|nr:23S rRNA (guanosine(2251)-2'-O)-methyltransferase RlmB [Candidatus Paceibacterota bacterium]MBP9840376.1 23S rRNA (guanosine(2251)-2'-O)-methyltransferase RlmB [Candidatus Paceibacterota bacterium]